MQPAGLVSAIWQTGSKRATLGTGAASLEKRLAGWLAWSASYLSLGSMAVTVLRDEGNWQHWRRVCAFEFKVRGLQPTAAENMDKKARD